MEKEFELLIDTLKSFEGFDLIEYNFESKWILFKLRNESSVKKVANKIGEVKGCGLVILPNSNNENSENLFKLIFEKESFSKSISILTKRLILDLRSQKNSYEELGIPDLSLVTIKQMGVELKRRHNLIFALIWIENNERDNIAIEGSGNPTQLVGLLNRGAHMAIEWADKNIKFYNNDDKKDKE